MLRRSSSKKTAEKVTPEFPPSSSSSDILSVPVESNTLSIEASSSAVEAEDDSLTCAICRDSLQGHSVGIIRCGHEFCVDCIHTWSKRENTCPLCKQRFTSIKRREVEASPESTSTGKKKIKRSHPKSIAVRNRNQNAPSLAGIGLEHFFFLMHQHPLMWLHPLLNYQQPQEVIEIEDEDLVFPVVRRIPRPRGGDSPRAPIIIDLTADDDSSNLQDASSVVGRRVRQRRV